MVTSNPALRALIRGLMIRAGGILLKRIPIRVVRPTYTPEAIALIHSMTGTNENRMARKAMTRTTRMITVSKPAASISLFLLGCFFFGGIYSTNNDAGPFHVNHFHRRLGGNHAAIADHVVFLAVHLNPARGPEGSQCDPLLSHQVFPIPGGGITRFVLLGLLQDDFVPNALHANNLDGDPHTDQRDGQRHRHRDGAEGGVKCGQHRSGSQGKQAEHAKAAPAGSKRLAHIQPDPDDKE